MTSLWEGWAPVNVRIEGPALVCESRYALKAMRRLPLAIYARRLADYSARYRAPGPATAAAVPATLDLTAGTDQQPKPELAFWFSCNGTVLPSHWPFGVIADLLGSTPPWSLSCHFVDLAGAPAFAIPVAGAETLATDVFVNSLKESVYIKTGSANSVLSLSRKHTELLLTHWASSKSDFTTFKRISDQLSSKVNAIPLKIYRDDALLRYSQSVQADRTESVLKSPFVRAHASAAAGLTIGEYLHKNVPKQFPSPRAATDFRAMLHGVTVPLSAPLNDLLEFAYPDGFLHISVTSK